jgi:hypothetical protein
MCVNVNFSRKHPINISGNSILPTILDFHRPSKILYRTSGRQNRWSLIRMRSYQTTKEKDLSTAAAATAASVTAAAIAATTVSATAAASVAAAAAAIAATTASTAAAALLGTRSVHLDLLAQHGLTIHLLKRERKI